MSVEAVDLRYVLFLGHVPNEAVEVVVPGEQQSPRVRGGYGRDTTKDGFVSEIIDFTVATHIEKPAVGIVGACDERLAIGKKLDGVDVRLMPNKCLHALAFSYIPHFGSCVARSRHKHIRIGGVN